MTERRSLYAEYPDYRVDLEPSVRGVRIRIGDEVVAESRAALRVLESKLAPVVYVPLSDVRSDLIEPTTHSTFCPFKGEASYWNVKLATGVEENVIWGYRTPFEEVAGLAGYVAFYPDRSTLEELD
jgi:uncharacterized protein (DUF427 family)